MELDPTNNYRRALELRRQGDFTAAIAALDVCLCSKPSSGLAMIAWEALATTIMLKFDFTSFRSPLNSIDECAWVSRVGQCLKNALEIYEQEILNTTDAERYSQAYELVKRHSASLMTYGLFYRDEVGNKCFADPVKTGDVQLPTIKCLEEQERLDREAMAARYGM